MAVVRARHPKRGEIYLVGLDPTRGREIKKTRPCVVVSPDELNAHLQTVIVAPLTSAGKPYPFRVTDHRERSATAPRDVRAVSWARPGPGGNCGSLWRAQLNADTLPGLASGE